MHYSYLRAVIGSRRDARIAGATPKTIPTSIENPKERATDQRGISVVKNWLTIRETTTPRAMPKSPPIPDNVNASIRN